MAVTATGTAIGIAIGVADCEATASVSSGATAFSADSDFRSDRRLLLPGKSLDPSVSSLRAFMKLELRVRSAIGGSGDDEAARSSGTTASCTG